MRILYIAYSCSPCHGSEDAIGWNIPGESARENTVFVITKEEQRQYIEEYAKQNELKNIKFYYVDIPGVYKKLFKGPFYSGRLNIWNRKARKLAEKLCQAEKIELIHQITPVEFRSVGDYGRIPNIKFVCGPLGGAESMPDALRSYAALHMAIEWIRKLVNCCYRFRYKILKKLEKCQCILFANCETRDFLSGVPMCGENRLYTEIGIKKPELIQKTRSSGKEKCVFLVAGRLVYRKGHALLLDALREIPAELEWKCRIAGTGPEEEHLQMICRDYGLTDHVDFLGNVPYEKMNEMFESADVLIMPSLRETTGTVVLEAMAKGLPVITINKFGAAALLDNNCGWLYAGDNKESYIKSLRDAVTDCIQNPDEVKRRGGNAGKIAEACTWEQKNAYYQSIYRQILQQQ